MKLVAVLGAGPAGLMAAQALSLQENVGVAIFSATPEPSKLGGAQFLHKAIPIVNSPEPDAVITYRVKGDEETYRRKVYGAGQVPFTSFANVRDGDQQPAWNLIETYAKLWDKFGSQVTYTGLIDARWLEQEFLKQFTLIISSIPLPAICRAQAGIIPEHHQFTSQQINVCIEQYGAGAPPNTIVYDGTDDTRFYRQSQVFGVHGTEWASNPPPGMKVVTDTKPISTTCNCHPDILRVGRRGTWRKGVLTHDAFIETWKAMEA